MEITKGLTPVLKGLLAFGIFAITALNCAAAQASHPALIQPAWTGEVFVGRVGASLLRVSWQTPGPSTWDVMRSTNLVDWALAERIEVTDSVGTYYEGRGGRTAGFFRIARHTFAPEIVDQPQGRSVVEGEVVPLMVVARAPFPVIHRWYQGTVLFETFTNTQASALGLVEGSGEYRVVVSNPWGSVTSQVARVQFNPPPNYAPPSISGRIIEIEVEEGTFPFAAPALYRIVTAGGGRAEYSIQGLIGVPDSQGRYTYTKTGATNATATFNDSITGASQAALVFESATTGSFTLTKPGLSGRARGRFSIQ
jgi:hypothetical protein